MASENRIFTNSEKFKRLKIEVNELENPDKKYKYKYVVGAEETLKEVQKLQQ